MKDFICPQRAQNNDFSGFDKWRENDWDGGGAFWQENIGKQPRKCSYCGCAHIKDAIAMIEAGWDINPSTKSYKWYLEPAGYNVKVKKLRACKDIDEMKKIMDASVGGVIPPVKLYAVHATPEELETLNRLLDKQNEDLK